MSTTPKITKKPAACKPTAPPPTGETVLVLTRAQFRRIVRSVACAASTDESRPIICGVLVEVTESEVSWTATDSYRLHHAITPADGPKIGAHASAIIPAALLKLAAKIPMDKLDWVRIGWSDTADGGEWATVNVGRDTSVSARVIAGPFPKYRPLLDESKQFGSVGYMGDVMLNATYFAAIVRAATAWNAHQHMRTHLGNGVNAARFEVVAPLDQGTLTMLMMPVRLPGS